MGDKVYTLVIKVDLNCCRCHVVIQNYLCKIQCKENIVSIVYDVKNNVIRVSGPFDAAQLQRHLLCKFPKIIKGIEIIKPKPPDPPKPKDECKEKCMKWCEEKCQKICKCIEECKKDCEEKCKCKCKCKPKPKCCKEKPPCKEEEPPVSPPQPPVRPPQPPVVCPQPPIWPPPPICQPEFPIWPPRPPPSTICPWPQQVICCVNPCPCFVAWSNNWKCCNCGVVCWPAGPGWGSGQGPWGRTQGGCGQGRNVVIESSPPCTIM